MTNKWFENRPLQSHASVVDRIKTYSSPSTVTISIAARCEEDSKNILARPESGVAENKTENRILRDNNVY